MNRKQFLGVFQDGSEKFIVCEFLEKGSVLSTITKEKETLSLARLLSMWDLKPSSLFFFSFSTTHKQGW
jgi:hypothetical protein